jgi:hypothetical protein
MFLTKEREEEEVRKPIGRRGKQSSTAKERVFF